MEEKKFNSEYILIWRIAPCFNCNRSFMKYFTHFKNVCKGILNIDDSPSRVKIKTCIYLSTVTQIRFNFLVI